MKKQLLFFWLFLAATALNAQIMIGGGTSTGLMPMSTTFNFNYTQQILPKPGIGAAAAGTITGVTFFVSPTATLSNTSDWTVYMGHTSKGSFASTSDWIPISSLTQVYQGNVSINNGKVDIVFTTPFAYNNTDNLAIAIDENSPGSESELYFYTYSGGSNTAIYYRNNTTNPNPASPPAGTRTATKSAIQLNGLTVSGVPNCPTVSAPAAAATGVSLLPTITWGLSQNASGYRISMGTAPNGTDVLNNVDVGNVNSYTLSTPLSLNTQYYYTVSSYNSAGNSTTCAERSFTTNTTPDCPTVTAPAASALDVPVLPTITWDSALGASGYLISIGTTSGGTDVANNVDVGNATTFTPATPLMNGTRYYYTVRSYSGTMVSPSCTERNLTTVCGPMPVLFENFDSYATGSIVPQCWARIVPATTPGTQTISSTTPASGTRNIQQTASTTQNPVIVVLPEFSNVNAGTHWLKFKARTSSTSLPGALEVGYVTDIADANTFVNIQTLDITNNSYGNSYYTVIIPTWIPSNARLAVKNPPDGKAYFWDDVYWEAVPTCFAPTSLTVTGTTPQTVSLTWTASSTPLANGYEIYYSPTNTPPTAASVPQVINIMGTSTTITGLTPSTGYHVWIRSNCAASDQSSWSATAVSFSTDCQPPAITGTTGATVCPTGATATLTATADAGADITWYDAATGGNVVGTGGTYTTPPLTATTDYWVSASVGSSSAVGKTTYNPSPSSGAGTTDFGIVFDALQQVTIESVTVYPVSSSGASGTVIIDVIDSAGNIVQTGTFNVTGAPLAALVPQVLNLNFVVPAGTNYKMRPRSRTVITGFAFDPSANAPGGNYGYPFSIPGLVTLNASTLTGHPTNTPRLDLYYYFYNWQVSTKCESARTMVTATLDPVCLSTVEIEGKDNVRISPNPFTDVINISDARNLKSVTVLDASGRMVKTIANPGAQINLAELKSGLYLLNLSYADGNTKTVKVIKR